MTGLSVELLRGAGALDEVKSEWQRLWLAQPRREVFMSRAWCLATWQADGRSEDVLIVTVRRDGEMVGLLPLSTAPVGFLSGANADYNDMLVSDGTPAEVVAAALQAVQAEFAACVFDNLPEWSTLRRVVGQLPARLRAHILVESGQPCPALRLTPDRNALLASMVGKQSLKRHEKKLARHGALRLWHIHDRVSILGLLDDFFAQHIARRALAGGRSLFLEERSRVFYRHLINEFDPAAELRFAVLEVGGHRVAYHLGFEVDGRFTWYKPSFDVDYWDCGVGEVLLKSLLEYVRDRPVDEFDFTRGDEAFKSRFSNHQGDNVRWTLFRDRGATARASWRSRIRHRLKHQAQVNSLSNWLSATSARCRPAPGRRPGRLPDSRTQGALLGLHRLVWQREQTLFLASSRNSLLALQAQSASSSSLSVLQEGLRSLAMMAVKPDALLDFDDLQLVRATMQHGDRIFVARQDAAVVSLALVGHRSRLNSVDPALQGPELELQAPALVIQFIGDAWPAPDPAGLISILAMLVQDSPLEAVWIPCPASARGHLRVLRQAGFLVRGRIGGSSLFSGPWHRWRVQAET